MPVLMIATYNEDGSVDVMNAAWGMMLERGNVNIEKLNAIAFAPYTHGYYSVSKRVGNAFKEGLKLK